MSESEAKIERAKVFSLKRIVHAQCLDQFTCAVEQGTNLVSEEV